MRSAAGAAPLLFAVVVVLAQAAAPAAGQLSPGDLSRPHAGLEGSGRCLECHEAKKGVAPERCLACHDLLRERVESGLGLHAQSGYERCETCHIEHHGSDFELVWWGDEGESAFDHRLAGYALEGAHRDLACRDCHKPELIADPQALVAAEKRLDRTFLGLRRETCLACHADEHQGQFEAGTCLDCHVDTAWKPAARFDHARARFSLTGRHLEVGCAECHVSEPSSKAGEEHAKYLGVAFARCTDCHNDPHGGRLGGSCESCHDTNGWQGGDRRSFDHDRTRFSLVGAHAKVACEGCHPAGRPLGRLRFERCVDCHQDVHLGQLVPQPPERGCEACHTLERFVPSTLTLASHQETDFPLAGGHLATPCNACHRRVPVEQIAGLVSLGAGRAAPPEVIQFRFVATRCRDCHEDPHEGSTAEVSGEQGCSSCHVVTAWRVVAFDHRVTDFALEGAHATAGCGECHARGAGEPGGPLVLSGAPTNCVGCHEDVHRGQFDDAGEPADCGRCHAPTGWRPARFDHDRSSRFALEGAHSRVACAACHEPEGSGPEAFVRYKPLPTECSECHSGEDLE